MANILNYYFDRTHIKNAAYFPRGHGEIEDDQTAIRRGFRELLEWKRAIPMFVTNLPVQQPPSEQLKMKQQRRSDVAFLLRSQASGVRSIR
jgi:hypothetical protein